MSLNTSGRIGWWGVAAASIGLVVASTTFAGDFNGYGIAGTGYLIILLIGFILNLFVAFAYAELTTMFPQAGQIFEFTKQAFSRQDTKTVYLLATSIGTAYWLIFGLVWASEASAGAYVIESITGFSTVVFWIVLLNLFAMGVNMLGIRITILTEIFLVLLMVGVRILFGLAAYFGYSRLEHGGDLAQVSMNFLPHGTDALLSTLYLGVWAFIGLEFATPLVNEVKDPSKNIPKGITAGAFLILIMSFTMGIGITSALDPVSNAELYIGNTPQIRIAGTLFGNFGEFLATISSIAATVASLLIAYAAIPRILYAMARDGAWPSIFGWVHPRFKSPWVAILATGVIFILPALLTTHVTSLIHAATIVWLFIYLWTLILVIKLRITHPELSRPFKRHLGFYFAAIFLIMFVMWKGYQGRYVMVILAFGIFLSGFLYSIVWYTNKMRKSQQVT